MVCAVVPQETGLDLTTRDTDKWWEGILISGGKQGHGPEQWRRDPPTHTHLMHCTCCQFRAAALRLSYVGEWQRHGLQTSVLLQGLSHIQQTQS